MLITYPTALIQILKDLKKKKKVAWCLEAESLSIIGIQLNPTVNEFLLCIVSWIAYPRDNSVRKITVV